ncbi:MAG TPA: RagB/SusD family nutrient uptake outer membrane protein [Phnomibacter sp.]|nr:RagB/SusD family nutrient uptake outer membrane protein [Phnomibacter sp.]
MHKRIFNIVSTPTGSALIMGILLTCTLGVVGCKKFLAQEPYNRISVAEIFKDFEGARTTLIGAYDNLKDVNFYERALGLYADLTGGNIKYARSTNQAFFNTYFFGNSPIADQNELQAFYLLAYNTIYRANALLQNADKIADANRLQLNRMKADAYTFRALCHFELVRVFAQPYNFTPNGGHPGIVIRTQNTSADEPIGEPSTVGQVYNQIVADLDSALLLYPNSVPIYASGPARSYFSADFAKALLVRVYQQREDWPKVVQYATELISAGTYTFAPNFNYVQGWRRNGNGAMDNEAIFYLLARTDINQGAFGDNFNPQNTQFGYMGASNDLLNIFEPGDIRGRSTMFVTGTGSTGPAYFTRKYQGRNDSADNQKLVRISEIILARAEAHAESNNLAAALTDLNRIRQRANPATPALTINNRAQLVDSIMMERRRELCFEGHLLYDITRKKKNLVRLDCVGSNCSVAYPSPLFAVPRPTQR